MKTPKFLIRYGMAGVQKCYSRKDIGDFLAYLAAEDAKSVVIEPVKKQRGGK